MNISTLPDFLSLTHKSVSLSLTSYVNDNHWNHVSMLKKTKNELSSALYRCFCYLLMPEGPCWEKERRTCLKFDEATPNNADQQALFVQYTNNGVGSRSGSHLPQPANVFSFIKHYTVIDS